MSLIRTIKITQVFTCVIIVCASLGTYAQTDCSHALIQAERAYYSGQFRQVEGFISKCLVNGFTKEQKVQAYKLIALSSIFLKNLVHADSSLLLMLRTDPQFEANNQDPPEFKKRVATFKVHPLVEITGNLGLIQPFFHATDIYNSRIVSSSVKYKGKIGLHVGLGIGYYISQRISLRAAYESQRYSLIVEDQNEYNNAKLTENQTRRQWQTAIGYSFNFRRLKLETFGGIVYSTLKKADANLVVQREDGSDGVVYFSNLSNRTKNELRPMIEMRLNVPAKNKWRMSFSLRYELGIENLTSTSERFSDLNQAATFEWIEDDFKGNYLVANISVSKLFYRIKAK